MMYAILTVVFATLTILLLIYAQYVTRRSNRLERKNVKLKNYIIQLEKERWE